MRAPCDARHTLIGFLSEVVIAGTETAMMCRRSVSDHTTRNCTGLRAGWGVVTPQGRRSSRCPGGQGGSIRSTGQLHPVRRVGQPRWQLLTFRTRRLPTLAPSHLVAGRFRACLPIWVRACFARATAPQSAAGMLTSQNEATTCEMCNSTAILGVFSRAPSST